MPASARASRRARRETQVLPVPQRLVDQGVQRGVGKISHSPVGQESRLRGPPAAPGSAPVATSRIRSET